MKRDKPKLNETQNQQPCYEIRLKGHLDTQWSDWFSGMTVTLDNDDTLLTGAVVDQAALHGLLKKVRDLGMILVSVCPVQPELKQVNGTDQADQSSAESL